MPKKPSNSTAAATALQQLAASAIAAYAAADPASLRLIESAKKVAAAASTVLIHGESGTGEDLFYRLNVVPLEVLPLRERPADIPVIAARLLTQLAEQHRRAHLHLAPDALAALQSYAFPGNVRELRNLLERTLISRHSLIT